MIPGSVLNCKDLPILFPSLNHFSLILLKDYTIHIQAIRGEVRKGPGTGHREVGPDPCAGPPGHM